MQVVLDSWAILAWLQGEPGGALVRDLLGWAEGDAAAGGRVRKRLGKELKRPKIYVSVINLGEVFYILGRRVGERKAREAIEEIKAGVIEIVPVSEELVFEAASLKIKYPIAYADGFALASAIAKGGILVTGDPELKEVKEVPIIWIGE
jgi:predicted nucleic acid-binding protein